MGTPYIPIHIICIYIYSCGVSPQTKLATELQPRLTFTQNVERLPKYMIMMYIIYIIMLYIYISYTIIICIYIYIYAQDLTFAVAGRREMKWMEAGKSSSNHFRSACRETSRICVFKHLQTQNPSWKYWAKSDCEMKWQNNPRISSKFKSSLFFSLRGCAPSIACRVWNSREWPWKFTA